MRRKIQFDRSPAMKWVAVLALLLLAVFATAEAVHFHASMLTPGRSDAPEPGCSLCMAAHSATAPIEIRLAPILDSVFAPFVSSEPQLQSRLFLPVACIRPPPASA